MISSILFLILACAITWPQWITSAYNIYPSLRMTLLFLGGSGPMLSAFILSYLSGSFYDFFLTSLSEIPSLWSAFLALSLPLTVGVLSCEIHKTFRKSECCVWYYPRREKKEEFENSQGDDANEKKEVKTIEDEEYPPSPYPPLPGILVYFIFLLPFPILLFEEFGWRQFLYTHLFSLLHLSLPFLSPPLISLLSSLFVGVSWALWHLPLFHPGPNPKKPAHPLAAESVSVLPRR